MGHERTRLGLGTEVNWEALGAIGELAGAIGVVATLVYLAVQIRQNSRNLDQNTAAVMAASEIAGADEANVAYMAVARSPDLAEILLKGNRSFESLSPQEVYRFSAYWHGSFITHQNSYFHHVRGFTGEQAWRTYSRNMDQYLRLPGVYAWWKRTEHIFEPEFRTYINAKPTPSQQFAKES